MQRATQAVKANPRCFSFLLPMVTDGVGAGTRVGQEPLYAHLSGKTLAEQIKLCVLSLRPVLDVHTRRVA